jgi:hypothetical protein
LLLVNAPAHFQIADFGECLRFADHEPEGSIKATSSAFSSNSDYMSISSQSDSAFESLSSEDSALRRRRASTRAGIANGSIRGTAAYMV